MDAAAPMTVSTDNPSSYAEFFSRFIIPSGSSHKGQNGKVLIVGGSSLFHGAVLWSAEAASHFADMVHVASTNENNDIIRAIKKKWQNGIVVSQKDIEEYIKEDDVILMGNGMMRGNGSLISQDEKLSLPDILCLEDEGRKTYHLTRHFLHAYPDKKWVLDAGSLQMMDPQWLMQMHTPAILTPHQKEFEGMFGRAVSGMTDGEKTELVRQTAKQYHTVILLKAGYDVVSDGVKTYKIEGGNAGLTKGGTGDILAGLTASFYAQNKAVDAAVIASILLKKTAEDLSADKGVWFNNVDIIAHLPNTMHKIMKLHNSAYGQ